MILKSEQNFQNYDQNYGLFIWMAQGNPKRKNHDFNLSIMDYHPRHHGWSYRDAVASCAKYQAVSLAFDNGSKPSDLRTAIRETVQQCLELHFLDRRPPLRGRPLHHCPQAVCRSIVSLLHRSHCGLVKTHATARNFYYWPAMKNDLRTTIDRCKACQSSCPSLPVDNLVKMTSGQVMQQVSIDLFQIGSSHYLLLVDRFSGFPMVTRLKSLTSNTSGAAPQALV